MPFVTSDSGRVYHLGRNPRKDRPDRWKFELKPTTAAAPGFRSLSQYRLPTPFDQGQEGSCTANAGVLVQYMCANLMGVAPVILSRMQEYYLSRKQPDNNTFPDDSGASIEDPYAAAIQNGGLVAETTWPYDAQPAETPPASVATATKHNYLAGGQPIAPSNLIQGIRTALDNRQPSSIGFQVSQSMINDYEQTGVMLYSHAVNFEGGHDIVIWGECVPNAAAGLPTGGFIAENSWGETSPLASLVVLHKDAHSGDVILPFEMFDGNIVEDADAGVPMTSPAILSVAITAPTTGTVGTAVAFSATVTGAPTGSVLSYVWTANGTAISGANAATLSYTPTVAGSLVIGVTANVATTGATASASATVSVAAAPPTPTPTPTPTPAPSSLKTKIDAAEASLEGILAGYATQYPANAKIYNYTISVEQWNQTNQLDPILAGTATAVPSVEVPVYSGD